MLPLDNLTLFLSCFLFVSHICKYIDPKDDFNGFETNRDRGGGTFCFGANVTEAFLAKNNLQLLIRSHQVVMPGFKVLHNGLCVTVFSAPKYCGQMGNLGALVKFDQPHSNQPVLQQFEAADVKSATKSPIHLKK